MNVALLTASVAFQQNDEDSDDVMTCVHTFEPQSGRRHKRVSNLTVPAGITFTFPFATDAVACSANYLAKRGGT